jgi:ABC-2 type transport system ATP-binding protein
MLSWLAGQGRTVLVSSHQLSEMALIASDLVVIGQGRLIEQGTVDDFVARYADLWVKVKSPAAGPLQQMVVAAGGTVAAPDPTTLEIRGIEAAQVGELAASNGIVLHELSPQTGSLEDAFLKATAQSVEYHSGGAGTVPLS